MTTTALEVSLVLAYNISSVRTKTLANLEEFRAFTGLPDTLINDARLNSLLELAHRRIRAMTGRSSIDGLVNKELLGRSDGNKRDYFLICKPVLHTLAEAGGAATKNAADIKLFSLTADEDDFFTLIPHTEYTFNGETGHVRFNAADIPDAGLDLYVSYYYDTELLRQAEMCLAASWAFGQMAPTENRDGRPTRYKAEFDEIMEGYVGEDHSFLSTQSEEEKEGTRGAQSYYAERY